MLEAPALVRIAKEHKAEGLKVIAVNVNGNMPLERWKNYFKQFGGGSDIIYAADDRREAIMTLKVRTAGSTFVLDRKGRLVFSDLYATTYEVLKDAVKKANGG